MEEVPVKCNMCGKEIDEMDLKCNEFSLNHRFGYGSVHDCDTLSINLCSSCQDILTTYLIKTCKINPIQEEY